MMNFIRTLAKTEYLMIIVGLDIFSYFSLKPDCDPSSEPSLMKTVQMRGHNLCLYIELTKPISNIVYRINKAYL